MLTTAELRWFKCGTLPTEVFDWFKQHQHEELGEYLAAPEEREDLYLYAKGCDYLGIKLRQGRLEIKWRQAELGYKCFTEQVEGKLEKWSKWLCEDPTSQSFQPATVKEEGGGGERVWVGVKKQRFHRLYQVLPNQAIASVPVTEEIACGCTFELTQLSIANDAWWSLAFEAFGRDDVLMEYLQTVATWVLKTNRVPKLLAEDSYAYPKWLTLVLT